MKDKSTSDLQAELMNAPSIDSYIKKNETYFSDQSVARMLKELYETRDLTKAELARRSGISEVYLHQVFSGRRNPSRDRLVSLLLVLCLCACQSKSEAAAAADELITGIGEVTLESVEKIEAAQAAVDALSEEDRADLENQQILADAHTAYDALLAEKKAEEDAVAAGEIDALIQALPAEVTMEHLQAVKDARNAYNTATADVQGLVTQLSRLEELEGKLAEQKKAAADAALAKMTAEVDEVRGMTFYYSKAWPYYADTRSYVLPYIGTSKDNTWLRLAYHYTGEDWVFFTDVTVSVDGENYYRTFSYYDVERDNQYGNVWEWIDVEPDDSDVEMLRAVAASEKTIVRFQGDTYWSDLVVTAEDKAAINEILDTFEMMT